MTFKEGKCPECGGTLQIPDNLDKVICMYCGKEILKSLAVKEAESQADEDAADVLKADEYMEIAMDRLPGILLNLCNALEQFKKDKYADAFKICCTRNEYIMEAIEKLYKVSENREEVIRKIADNFASSVDAELNKLGRKKAIENQLVEYNFRMATYVIPSILEYGGMSSDILADEILAAWRRQFPKTNLGKAGFEEINGGFKRKLCYITTAVCESFGKPDDCYELTLLRNYRDGYLKSRPEGDLLIQQYYDIAPTIVKRINKLPNQKEIYSEIWNEYLRPCIRFIEEDANEKCQEVYTKMVMELKDRFTGQSWT